VNTFRDISEEALHFRRTQITKYTHVYSVTFQMLLSEVVNVPTKAEAVLNIMEDSDFHITHLSGSVVDTVTSNGIPSTDPSNSGLGLLFPVANANNRGERGVFFKIMDPEVNRPLTSAVGAQTAPSIAAQYLETFNQTFLSFNNTFTPGYGFNYGKPLPFDYCLTKGMRLKILFENRQAVLGYYPDTDYYSRISMAFIGQRYDRTKR